jgi:FMN reductase
MEKPVRIVGMGGSMAESSSSLRALKLALEGAKEAGAQIELLDIRTLSLPFYVPGTRAVPEPVRLLVTMVYEADGLIWSSPLYHGTISGVFKNALDWLDLLEQRDPVHLTDKVIGLISTAAGTQGLQAINTMEFVVRALRGWAVPLVVPISRARKTFDACGHVLDPEVESRLRSLGREVWRVARQFRLRQLGNPAEKPESAEPAVLSLRAGSVGVQ